MLVSDDAGATWETRSVPEPLIDLALSPADRARWVATTASGIFASVDDGSTWREERGSTGGEPRELTAATADELYAALLDGTVSRSADGGGTWTAVLTP